MAYKFQLGAAKLAGSVESTGAIDGAVISGSAVEADFADLVVAAVADGDIPIAKLAEQSVSFGGISLDLGGVDATPAFDLSDATDYPTSALVGTITNTQLSGAIANAKLANSTISGKALGTDLDALAVDDASIEYSAGSAFNGSAASTIQVKALGVTNAMLAGSILNAKLANSTISSKALGTDLDALTDGNGISTLSYNGSAAKTIQLQLSSSNALIVDAGGVDLRATITGARTFSNDLTMGASASVAGDFVVSGDLTVNGSLAYIDTTNLRVSDALVTFASGTSAFGAGRGFEIGEGSAAEGNFKTAAAAGDLPNHFASSLALSSSAYYGDGSNLQGVSATAVQMVSAKFDSGASATGSISNERYVIADSAAAAMLINLPSIAPAAAGTMIIIKRVGGNNVTISAANSNQDVEGSDQDITLESDGAAVTLMATDEGDVTHGGWRIV